MRKHESGRSMIEMVGVLAVMGLITAGVFVLLRSGMSSQKRNRAQDEVANIAANIRTLSAALADFSNLPRYNLDKIEEGANFLNNLDIQTTTPYGENTFYSVSQADKNPAQFVVWIVGINSKACESLNLAGWAEGSSSCNGDLFGVTYGK